MIAAGRWTAGAALTGLLVLGAACERARDGKAGAPAPTTPPPAVVVAEVVERTIPITRDFVARTEAVPTVDVRARVAGVLEQVLFKEGSVVSEGQDLFVIQPEEYRAALRSARAQLSKARADLTRAQDASVVDRARAQLDQAKAELGKAQQDVARYRPLAAARAIPQQDLDTGLAREQVTVAGVEAAEAVLRDTILAQRSAIELAEAAVEAASAGVTQAELNLSYTAIRSPITGLVGKIEVDRGNLVGKSEATLLTTISAIDPIFADFAIPEADYLRLSRRQGGRAQPTSGGPTFELILADNSPFPQSGRLMFVDRAVDPNTGTIGVRAEFRNPDRILRPGQFARVRAVVGERAAAILVPQKAVQELQGAKTVLVVGAGDTVEQRTVTVDGRTPEHFVIGEGVKPGERVIVEGLQKARPGLPVKPETQPLTVEPAGAPGPKR
jgi:membrane fusion protein (multidrug efflux system)